jgi:diguanylate cyclase
MDPILARLADSVAQADSLQSLTRPLLELLEAVTGLESTYLTRIDFDEGVQHVLYARNTRSLEIPEGIVVPWSDTLCKRALDEGRMYTDDVAGCWGDSDAARALGIATYVSTPVRLDDGEVYGTLCAASGTRAGMPDGADRVLDLFACLIARHVERERLLQRLQAANEMLAQTACTDALTRLPNRRAFDEELARMLARCRRDGSSLAVAYVDLDGLKAINDRLGHGAGDELLVHLARAIEGGCRAGDFVARVGGDEFVVLAPIAAEAATRTLDALAGHLDAATRGRYRVAGEVLDYAGASVGVVMAGDEDAASLVARADAAMYERKRSRRECEAR